MSDPELSVLDLVMGYYNGEGIDPPISPPLVVELAIWNVQVSTLFARDMVAASTVFERVVEG